LSTSRRERKFDVVTTDIPILDRILGGGLPNGSVIVLMGEPGSGFDLFAQQIMYLKAKNGNSKVAYFSVDRPSEDVKNEMAIYGWDIEALEKENIWAFIDAYAPRQEVRRGMTGRRIIIEMLATKLPQAISEGRCSVVDTFSYFLLFYDLKDIIDLVETVILQARKHGGIHFFLVVSGLHDDKTITTLVHFTDGMLEFILNPEEEEAVGTIRIKKLRRVHHIVRSIPYRIVSEGITVETTMRIA